MGDRAAGEAVAARLGVAACTETPIRQIEAYALVEGAERNEMSKAGDSPRQRQLRAAAIVETSEYDKAISRLAAEYPQLTFGEVESRDGCWLIHFSCPCRKLVYVASRPPSIDEFAKATEVERVLGCTHYGKPVEAETFDGLTAAECLEIYERRQRDSHAFYMDMDFNGSPMRCAIAGHIDLTPLQLSTARREWSAALRARVEEQKAKEGAQVVVDDDRWEP